MQAHRIPLAVLLVAMLPTWFGSALARQDDIVGRDVIPAVVQISVRVVESGGGLSPTEHLVPRGSGTVIAPHGLVLTSAHVLDVADLAASAAARQADYQVQGIERTVRVVGDEYVLSFPLLPDESPIALYTAAAERVDAELLDLAVLRIVGGPKNQPVSQPDLPFVPLGDSDLLNRGDEIAVVGYPGIARTVVSDSGEVNGFETAPGISGRAWIITDAVVSGGSSGGAAVDAAGRLIGVTTLASELECRPGDTNGDGAVDELDAGCIPVGSALARLRPINLALPLLAEAGLASPTEPPGSAADILRTMPTPLAEATIVETPTLPPASPSSTLTPPPPSAPAPSVSTPILATPASPATAKSPSAAMFRGNLARTGEAPGPGPRGDPVVSWTFATDGAPASPVVADGVVYVGSTDWFFYALDASSGAERWRVQVSGVVFAAATVVDGVVYVADAGGAITALDAQDGAERWSVATGSTIEGSPAVADGVVYAGNADGIFFALDATTGVERWRVATGAAIEASPALVGNRVFVGNNDGAVFAFDVASGGQVWRAEAGFIVSATVAVSAGIVYVADYAGGVSALDAGTGVERWRAPTGYSVESDPAVAGGTVYVGDYEGFVVALDAATGEERWRLAIGRPVVSAPTVADGVVYVGSGTAAGGGALHAIAAASGEELWRIPAGSGVATSPAVVGGAVFFGSEDGAVYAVVGTENG